MTFNLDKFGCEFYSGNAQKIAQACLKQDWDELKSGRLTTMFVGFPLCVRSLDFLLLPKAISQATKQSEVVFDELFEKIAGDEGTWGADLLPRNWVSSIAEISTESVIPVWQYWSNLNEQEYDFDEDWQSPDVVKSLFDLRQLCQLALSKNEDVVQLWIL